MAASPARLSVDVDPSGREDPLPHPLPTSCGIFAGERIRKLDPTGATVNILLVLLAHPIQVRAEVPLHGARAPPEPEEIASNQIP